jgi:hypothetical protein
VRAQTKHKERGRNRKKNDGSGSRRQKKIDRFVVAAFSLLND